MSIRAVWGLGEASKNMTLATKSIDKPKIAQKPCSCGDFVEGPEIRTSRFFRITFPEKGKPVLNVGPGDHTVQRWELSMDDLKSLVRDALPELLR